MKRKLLLFLSLWAMLVILMILQKFVFIAIQPAFSWADFANIGDVIRHGIGMDLSMSAYLMAPVVLWMIAQAWYGKPLMLKILNSYLWFVAAVFSIVLVVDSVLYPYWQIRLDATPVFYFTTSPGAALASMAWWWEVLAVIVTAVIAWGVHQLLKAVAAKFAIEPNNILKTKIIQTVSFLIIGGAMIIPIRGGVTVSTMSPGQAYFSSDMRLNHAAINPMFNFVYSITRIDNLGSTFRYMDPAKADGLMRRLESPAATADSTAVISVKDSRPDIYLVILESFSAQIMPSLGGEDIATNLDKIAREGALFTNFYAESFRTDRALATILGGYPALPTTSVMRYPNKFAGMPSLAHELKKAGYHTYYYYGGDADFTNMNAYLVATGYDNIVSDNNFPVSERLSKWGAPDHAVFARALADKRPSPSLTVVQTSSSHEPYEVPYQSRHTDIRANAFAYADSCMGDFVAQLKADGRWDNAMVVIVPDHWGSYPKGLEDHLKRHHIPLVITGGAVAGTPARIATTGSQSAIAPTVLAMLGLDYSGFFRPVNLLDNNAVHRAWLTETEWFSLIDADGNISTGTVADKKTTGTDTKLLRAYIQTIYSDLDKR